MKTVTRQDISVLLSYLHGTGTVAKESDLRHDLKANSAAEDADRLRNMLAKYFTREECDPDKKGHTVFLQFLGQLAQYCTEDEALQIYIFAAEMSPDYRWTQYSRYLCPTSCDEWESKLLQVYLQATSQFFPTFLRILLSKRFTQEAAFSVSAMDILYVDGFGYAGVSRWKPGKYAFENCRIAIC